MVAVASLVPNPLNSLIAYAGSRVTGPGTIAGASIGVTGLPTDDAIIRTLERSQHLDPGALKEVNVGFNLVPALLAHKVDAIVGDYRNVEGIEIALKTGAQPTVVPLERLGVPPFDELVIVANRSRSRATGPTPVRSDASSSR